MSKCWKKRITFFSIRKFQSKGRPEWQPVYGKNKLAAPAKGSTNAFKFSDSGHISTYMWHTNTYIDTYMWHILQVVRTVTYFVITKWNCSSRYMYWCLKLLEFGHIITTQMAILAKWSKYWRRRVKIWQWLKASQRRCIKKWCCYPLTILYEKLNNIS